MKINYRKMTLVSFLEQHPEIKSVLLEFDHGMGDTIMLEMYVLPVLRRKYPEVRFDVRVYRGQDCLDNSYDPNFRYDVCVALTFPCAEWDLGLETKAEKCLRCEIGIPVKQDEGVDFMPPFYMDYLTSPFVGMHFRSTSCLDVCASEDISHMVWDAVVARGLCPIDTHLECKEFRINDPTAMPWETRHCRDIKPDVRTLWRMLNHCCGFAGVSSGNFWTALNIFPSEHILYIETEFPACKLTHRSVHSIRNVSDRDEVERWLDDVQKG